MKSWFTSTNQEEKELAAFSDKPLSFASVQVPYEFMTEGGCLDSPSESSSLSCLQSFRTWLSRQPDEEDTRFLCELVDQLLESVKDEKSRFIQFDAPLSLIITASRYNRSTDSPSCRIRQLYIAQCDIRDLPAPLREDFPTPKLISEVGKGDLYGSSIWLGLQHTYTPLHRDPNPNLFYQLVGSKVVRIMEPEKGLTVFRDVHERLGTRGNSRFRGPEMMDGPERDGLHRAVWDDPDPSASIWQGILGPGDALFIPKGWWHSFKSVGQAAELNASANWWFR
ncbi:hypothetical protein ONZ43_g6937 [Nemania bipapillata]|uniref:Uncharacterized protein n=1 Tax=Nemania bipapillata TaxID=110536 RepID=A0ACC2HVU1_9PEZI|nr:hypothetical protein ONZ43_g6937 [Nemania bipapillata]